MIFEKFRVQKNFYKKLKLKSKIKIFYYGVE